MDPWFITLASSIPMAAVLFVRIWRWRQTVRAHHGVPASDQPH